MRFIVCWLGFAGVLSAGLTFSEDTKELSPGLEETKVSAEFSFTNKSDKTVVIQKYDGACSCVSVQISNQGKRTYAPGESGVIRANFDMGNFWGTVDKVVSVWVDGDPEDRPSHQLTLRVNIPVLIELEPKTLKWAIDEQPQPQSIHIRMKADSPIRIDTVTASSQAFSHELKTIEEGKHYELVVTPKSTASPTLAIFKILTDCPVERHRMQQAFAAIQRPRPAGPKK